MARKQSKTASRPSSRVVNIGFTQMRCVEDVATNRKHQAGLIEAAARKGAQIVCTQEMFTSQYFCQIEDNRFFQLAETIPGPTTDLYCKLAKKHGIERTDNDPKD